MDFPTAEVLEGSARLIVPDLDYFRNGRHVEPAWAPVFYNPKMKLSRDISVSVLQAYVDEKASTTGRGCSICEPLSGTGVRGLRYIVEVSGIDQALLNDRDRRAFKTIAKNVEMNSMSEKVEIRNQDANKLLLTHAARGKRFDLIDIDPFGSPASFIENALKATRIDGLLYVTATDLGPLCGVNPEACLRRYGATCFKTDYSRETGARILIGYVCRRAARDNLSVKPLITQSSDHYLRICLKVGYGKAEATESLSLVGYVLHCSSCGYRLCVRSLTPPLTGSCPMCFNNLHAIGPLWIGDLFDKGFLSRVYQDYISRTRFERRGLRLIRLMMDEAGKPPLYYDTSWLASRYKIREEPSSKAIVRRLREMKIPSSLTHFCSKGFRARLRVDEILETISGRL